MSQNIIRALIILEQERAQLDIRRAKLDEAITSLRVVVDPRLNTIKVPVAEAIDELLQSSTRPLTVGDIVRAGLKRGQPLNANSVRWELRRAVEAGRYEKLPPISGRAKLYRPASKARATEPVDGSET